MAPAEAEGMTMFDSAMGVVEEGASVFAQQTASPTMAGAGQLVKGTAETADAVTHGELNADGIADMGIGGGKMLANAAETAGERIPFLDAAGGAVSAGQGAYEMHENGDQANDGYLTNKFDGGRNEYWHGAGEATLGSLHASLGLAEDAGVSADVGEALSGVGLPAEVLSVPETIGSASLDTALSVGETAVDGVGLVSGLAGEGYNAAEGLKGSERVNTGFDAADVVGLGEHAGRDAMASLYAQFAD